MTAPIIKKEKRILKKPRITEKATLLSGSKSPVYTFEVHDTATKSEIKKAVKAKYSVDAVKVNIVTLPAKTVYRRGRVGTKSGIKKAMITLKEGQTIDAF